MRHLIVLVTAVLVAFGWTTTAPGQLGDAARMPSSLDDRLPLAAGNAALGEAPAVDAAASQALSEADAVPRGRIGPHLAAEVLRRTALRESPGGKIVTGIGPKTRFSGTQVLSVVARRGRWVGVLHQWMPNGKAGWVDAEDLKFMEVPWAIEVDRSRRLARVRYNGKILRRFGVAVGRPSSPTPVARFAVTDRLTAGPGSPYGCCILALSGRQPNLPAGWGGGDRLAMHGAPDDQAGGAVSTGCVRIRLRDLQWLMRRIPVGTRVTVLP